MAEGEAQGPETGGREAVDSLRALPERLGRAMGVIRDAMRAIAASQEDIEARLREVAGEQQERFIEFAKAYAERARALEERVAEAVTTVDQRLADLEGAVSKRVADSVAERLAERVAETVSARVQQLLDERLSAPTETPPPRSETPEAPSETIVEPPDEPRGLFRRSP